jgi:hypothetical protein
MAKRTENTSSSGSSGSSGTQGVPTGVTAAVAAADSNAAQAMQTLTLVYKARVAQLSRTAAALKAQFGAKNADVVDAENAVAVGRAMVARVTIAQQQASTVSPNVAEDGWTIHGRVYDQSLSPQAKFTVFLVDANRTYLQQFGFAYTDETGYFLISVSGLSNEAAQEGFLEVANSKGKPVYISSTPIEVQAGGATYQNIVLAQSQEPLGDPPKALRVTAIPPKPKK